MTKPLQSFADAPDPVLAMAALSELGRTVPSALRERALADGRIQALVARAGAIGDEPLASHKSASQPFHALFLLAELGFSASDAGVDQAASKALGSFGPDGMPRLPFEISVSRGGSGKREMAWALCDAPVTLYALLRLGADRALLSEGVDRITRLAFERGWPCAASEELGSWRGPGRKTDPCPYATLVSTRLLLAWGGKAALEAADSGAASLLRLWEGSRTEHPYIFYMGADFRKPKLPWFWYDIVGVLDVLSRHGPSRRDARFLDMLGLLRAKELPGGIVPESVYLAFKDWDFGQKKAPSAWLGFALARIEARLA